MDCVLPVLKETNEQFVTTVTSNVSWLPESPQKTKTELAVYFHGKQNNTVTMETAEELLHLLDIQSRE